MQAYKAWRATDAVIEFREELRDFSFDGLVQLDAALSKSVVQRGSWEACPLSYRRGHAGSADCDRKGRKGNVFTRFWDAQRIAPEVVHQLVREEISARTATLDSVGRVTPVDNVPADYMSLTDSVGEG